MIVHMCDASGPAGPCTRAAQYRAIWRTDAPWVEVCRQDLAWPAVMAAEHGDGVLRIELLPVGSPADLGAAPAPAAPVVHLHPSTPAEDEAEDHWALTGITYACTPKCGFEFQMSATGNWYVDTHSGVSPTGWRLVGNSGSWDELCERYGDCSAMLIRRYGGGGDAAAEVARSGG